MPECKVTIKEKGSLEACIELPGSSGPFPGVVICHPHPLYGGNMENSLVVALSRAITARGMAALRFNFRGVGASRGAFAQGAGETEDALSALSFLSGRGEVDPERIGIAGYSFGGMVAMGAGERSSLVKAMAAVSPVMAAGSLEGCVKPKYIISGAEDGVIPAVSILKGAEIMPGPKRIEIIDGADHFWWGQLEMVGNSVAGFFAENFGLA
ncbi:MAG: prolyl oligopeptidase family serine peptidase [Actinobacteria bacterium]|nr:prolyl oligopeptidase family serine peptidase [Actinomycetota bacterium]